MRLLKAKINNFLAIGEAEIPLDRQNLVLVLGNNEDNQKLDSNGAGKSSTFEAVVWALYGQTYQGLKHDDIVNNRAGKDTFVTVWLEAKGHSLQLTRYRKHSEHGNKLDIIVDGVRKTPFTINDAEDMVAKLLPYSFSSFSHVAYFGQGLGSRFSALNDAGRKELLEELLGLEIYAKAHEETKTKLGSLKLVQASLEGQKQTYEKQVTFLKEQLVKLEEASVKWSVSVKSEREKLLADHEALGSQIEALKEAKEVILDRQKSTQLELVPIKAELQLVVTEERNLALKAATADAEARSSRKEYTLSTGIRSYCNECRQDVPEAHRTKIAEETKLKLVHYEALAKQAREEAEVCKANLKVASDKASTLESTLQGLVQTLYRHNASQVEAETKLHHVLARFTALKTAHEGHEAQIAQQQERIKEAENAVLEATKALEANATERKYYEYWDEGFSTKGIRSLILDNVLDYLNKRLAHHAAALSDGEIAISLTPQTKLKSGALREKMAFNATTAGAGYHAASGGEKRRIDLSIHFALSDLASMVTGSKLNVLMVDEVGESLDASGIDAMLNLLRAKANEIGSVFLITHNDSLKDRVPNAWVVTKKNSVSSVSAPDFSSSS